MKKIVKEATAKAHGVMDVMKDILYREWNDYYKMSKDGREKYIKDLEERVKGMVMNLIPGMAATKVAAWARAISYAAGRVQQTWVHIESAIEHHGRSWQGLYEQIDSGQYKKDLEGYSIYCGRSLLVFSSWIRVWVDQ